MPVLLAAALLVALITLAERLWPARGEPAPRRLNLAIWGACLLLQAAAGPFALAQISRLITQAGPPSLQIGRWPLWLGAPTLILAMDLGEYLYHRAQHAIPWLWRRHALHHSDGCMTATTTQRHWWGDYFLKMVVFGAPLAALLRPSGADYAVYGLAALWNILAHANLPIDFGRWSWALNSPAYHRLHHARASEHYGANYAALLPIWDVISGAYRRPAGFVETGLAHQPRGLVQALAWPPARLET